MNFSHNHLNKRSLIQQSNYIPRCLLMAIGIYYTASRLIQFLMKSDAWVQIPILLLPRCVVLGKSSNMYEPQFYNLPNGNHDLGPGYFQWLGED